MWLPSYRFFCWRLLGLIPGGAPFSQLSSGVKDAMVVFTFIHIVNLLEGIHGNHTVKLLWPVLVWGSVGKGPFSGVN